MRTRRLLPLLASAVALVACPVAASADITELTTSLTPGVAPADITTGPDGNIWSTRSAFPRGIARVTGRPVAELEIEERRHRNSGSNRHHPHGALTVTIDANSQDTTYHVEYGPDDTYGSASEELPAGAGAKPDEFDVDLTLEPGEHYHARAVAANASGEDASEDLEFWVGADGEISGSGPDDDDDDGTPTPAATTPPTTADTGAGEAPAADAPAPPALGEGVVIRPVSGSVRFKARGASTFRDLGARAHVPVGSLVDARHGRVALQSARDTHGRTQTGTFWGGVFQVRQTHHNRGITDLHLRGGRFSACGTGVRAGASALAREAKGKRRVVRRLWGKDSHARFRTHGRDSVATVRGTRWVTTDRCDGTLTTVREGEVLVRDLRRKHSVLLTAGHAYLARHKRH